LVKFTCHKEKETILFKPIDPTEMKMTETSMTRKYWLNLTPSLFIAAGILTSTYVAVHTAESEWLILAAPLLLSSAILGADMWNSRLREKLSGPSPAALLFVGAFLLACVSVTLSDPGMVKTLIPILGAASWVTFPRPNKQRKTCTIA
jgi:hypothetical protein